MTTFNQCSNEGLFYYIKTLLICKLVNNWSKSNIVLFDNNAGTLKLYKSTTQLLITQEEETEI